MADRQAGRQVAGHVLQSRHAVSKAAMLPCCHAAKPALPHPSLTLIQRQYSAGSLPSTASFHSNGSASTASAMTCLQGGIVGGGTGIMSTDASLHPCIGPLFLC